MIGVMSNRSHCYTYFFLYREHSDKNRMNHSRLYFVENRRSNLSFVYATKILSNYFY